MYMIDSVGSMDMKTYRILQARITKSRASSADFTWIWFNLFAILLAISISSVLKRNSYSLFSRNSNSNNHQRYCCYYNYYYLLLFLLSSSLSLLLLLLLSMIIIIIIIIIIILPLLLLRSLSFYYHHHNYALSLPAHKRTTANVFFERKRS